MKSKYTWVLGGTGYIGRELVRQLNLNPLQKTVVFTHKTLAGPDLENAITLNLGLQELGADVFKRFPPARIFHLARFGAPFPWLRKLSAQKGANANSRLINLIKQSGLKLELNYVSGSLMYGEQMSPANEETKLNPIGFGKAYINGEMPFLNMQKVQNGNVHFYRPGWILGPSSWFKEFFWKPYLENGIVPYYGDGSQKMSIISLQDCAGLILHGAKSLEINQDLNPCLHESISQKEFAEKVAKQLNSEAKGISKSEMAKTMDYQTIEALLTSINLSTKHTDIINSYLPRFTNLESILEKTINELKEQ